MASAPPALRQSDLPPPLPAVEAGMLAGDYRADASVCFAVEAAPVGSSTTVDLGGGALAIRTVVRGRVLSVEPTALEIDHQGILVRLRYLLPAGVSLEPLAGHVVEARVDLLFHRHRAATVDAVVHDEHGRLLLWARDGALPSDREAQGVAVRVAQAPGGPPRLIFAAPGVLASVKAGMRVLLDGDLDLVALPLRVAADDAAFVLVRR